MSTTDTPKNKSTTPWFGEPWLWFILTPLIASIVLSMTLVFLAVHSSDDVVSDNYYREGRLLAQDFRADDYAKSLGLSAELMFKHGSSEVVLTLNQPAAIDTVALLLSHPAKAEFDRIIDMERVSTRIFRGDFEGYSQGRWYLRLTATQNSAEVWRLHGEVNFDTATKVLLE